jgi:hypothetical protein
MRTVVRTLTVAIAVASWLAISNHCAFAAIASKPQPTTSGCLFHPKPATPQQAPAGIQCCKILRAITTTPAKTVARALVGLAHVHLAGDTSIVSPPARLSFAPDTLDTGPPGSTSFSELIGSVQAHAPPARV